LFALRRPSKKTIAQYYQEEGRERELRIVADGSYVPTSAPPERQSIPAMRKSLRRSSQRPLCWRRASSPFRVKPWVLAVGGSPCTRSRCRNSDCSPARGRRRPVGIVWKSPQVHPLHRSSETDANQSGANDQTASQLASLPRIHPGSICAGGTRIWGGGGPFGPLSPSQRFRSPQTGGPKKGLKKKKSGFYPPKLAPLFS